jgi:glycosyltransferase involved in cell wall biosynthesis
MKISIIVPAHNEEKIIERTLSSLTLSLEKTKLDYEIVAVDDNSDDRTLVVIKNFAHSHEKVSVARKTGNRGPSGLGSALTFGFNSAKGEVLIPFMGDLSDNPNDIPRLVSKIEEGYDIVCGSRFTKGGKATDYPFLKFISHRFYNRLFSLIFGLCLKDFSNAFKAYRKEVLESMRMESMGFEFNAEVILKAHILGFKITEIPVDWENRRAGISKLGSFSPSIRFMLLDLPRIGWKYGAVAIKLYFKSICLRVGKKKLNEL